MYDVKSSLPELPQDRRDRFVKEYELREYDAQVLTLTRATGDYFETAVKASGDGRATANWVVGDLMGLLKAVVRDPVDGHLLHGYMSVPPAQAGAAGFEPATIGLEGQRSVP